MADASSAEGAVPTRLVVAALVGAAVVIALAVYSNVHDPTGEQPYKLFFTGTIQLKAWFATVAVLAACFQLGSAMWLYGKVGDPARAPAWLGDAHRLSGTVAFLFSLPVAYHCLWALGWSDADTRTVVHSLVGCFFYGAFATKVLVVRAKGLPGWALPVAGGAVFTALVAVWLTSALWFFTSSGLDPV